MTHKPYPRYKETGVEWLGEVPERWETIRLKFLLEAPLKYGANEVGESEDPTLPRYIRITDIDENDILRTDTVKSLSLEIAQEFLLREGDLLFARSGATAGKTFLYQTDWGRCAYAGYLIRARLNSDKVFPMFLRYFTDSKNYWLWIKSSYIQSTIQNISAEKYANITVALPPSKEQLSIISFLDRETSRIDTLISEKEHLIALLKEYRQALISHAVTKGLDPKVKMKDSGVEWLGEIPEHWKVKRLKHIADVRLSNVDKHTVEGQKIVRLCNYLDVYNNTHITSKIDFMSATASDEQIERLSLQKNDVLITKDSEDPSDIGIPALVEEDIFGLVCGYHLAILRPIVADGEFLHYLLQSIFVRSAFEVEATGMTRYALGKYSIENLIFALPHQSEQKSIASFLDQETSRIDTLISEVRKFIDLLKEYRSSLITAAVTGKIDVREVVPSGSEKREIAHE